MSSAIDRRPALEEPVAAIATALQRRRIVRARRRRITVWTLRGAVFVVVILMWQLSADQRWVDPFFASSPTAVATFLRRYVTSYDMWSGAAATIEETAIGFAIGSAAGIIFGLLRGHLRIFRDVTTPFITFLNSLPRVALAPMFIVWFGIGQTSKVVLAVSLVFFILLSSTEAGVAGTDLDQITMFRAMGATTFQTFIKLSLPSSVPSIFAGLQLGLVYSLLAAVFGEMLAATRGLGYQIEYYSSQFQMANVLGILVVLGVIALILSSVIRLVEGRTGYAQSVK